MIKDGDKILVCLSGGKDSLTLLHTLHQYKFYASSRGVRFELGAVTVDPGSSAYNPKPLITYMESLGVPYIYEEQSKFRFVRFYSSKKKIFFGLEIIFFFFYRHCRTVQSNRQKFRQQFLFENEERQTVRNSKTGKV